MSRIVIRLFGALTIEDSDGNSIAVSGSKRRALLSYLAHNLRRPPSRNSLINLLWGTRFDDQARQSLRQAISKLRQALNTDDSEVLWANADQVGLNPELVRIDTVDFETLVSSGSDEGLLEAARLFGGTLLDGMQSNEPAFDEWLLTERARLDGVACRLLEQATEAEVRAGKTDDAVNVAQRLIAIDPLREPSYRLLMRILAQSGQRAEAIRLYNTCEDVLRSELDVTPDRETAQLLSEIRAASSLPATEMDAGEKSSDDSAPSAGGFFGGQSTTTMPTIAVAPFVSLGGDQEHSELGNVIAEDLTLALTKYRWLSVISAGAQSDNGTDVKEKGVEYLIEGSVRHSTNRARLTAHLVDLETGKYLWVQRYDQKPDQLLSDLDEVTETIAATIESELTSFEADRAKQKNTDTLNAWDLYHLGLSTQYEFGKESNARAQELFRQAIEMDPNFGAAHARLSYAIVISAIYFEADENSGLLQEALDISKRATRLDSQDAIAHFALGRTYLALGDYEKSVTELEKSIELNPSLAQAHCGLGDSLAYAGRLDESVPCFEEAIRLSPNDPYRWAFLMYGSVAHLFMGHYEKAAEWAEQAALVPNSHFWANAALVAALGHMDRPEATEAAVSELLKLKPDFTCSYAKERLFYLRINDQVDTYVDGLKKAGIPDL